jgi:hypothetical protein
MKPLMSALAVAVVAVVSGEARANWGTPPGPPQGHAAAPENTTGRYGMNPLLKRMFWWKKDADPCGPQGCGKGHGHCFGGNCAPVPPPYGAAPPMPGTLVFPNHPFNRSPRDFFMQGTGTGPGY